MNRSQHSIQRTTSVVRDGLTSSNGRVALLGLIAALTTLGFSVWLKIDLRTQNKVRVPLARTASRLDSAIVESQSALKSWIITKDDAFRNRRAALWQDTIIPEIETLQKISTLPLAGDIGDDIDSLAADLRRLQVEQLWTEDIVHAPGNEHARELFSTELQPIVDSIQESTRFLLTVHRENFDSTVLVPLARYRAELFALVGAIDRFVDEADAVQKLEIDNRLQLIQRTAEQIKPPNRSDFDPDLRELLVLALSEFRSLANITQLIIEMRNRPDWRLSKAQRARIAPLIDKVRKASSALARSQTEAMRQSSKAAGAGTGIVVLLSLMVGFLSASGLYYSIRLQHRIHQISSKAQMLGQYAIENRIGGGAMGEVYQARHALLRRPTAIKLLRNKNAINPLAQDRFREEVQLTSQLTHPNTVQIFDYGRTPEGVFFYAMELLEGVTLEDLVQLTGPLPPERAVYLLQQVCGSLNEAHQQRLIHRDLKPSNIMVTKQGGQWDVIKVLDFGLAAPIEQTHHQKQQLVGTPNYIAPEVIESPDLTSTQADLYAIGAVAYFLISGTVIFPDRDVEDILRAHVNDPVVPPSHRLGRVVPEGLEAVIMACLSKTPSERPVSANHLGKLFEASLSSRWTPDDARAWWNDFGDALAAATRPQTTHADIDELAIERTLSASRS